MSKKKINKNKVAEAVESIIRDNFKDSQMINEIVKNASVPLIYIGCGPVSYEIWKTKNAKKFELVKSVIPGVKTADKDFCKVLNSTEIIKEINQSLKEKLK